MRIDFCFPKVFPPPMIFLFCANVANIDDSLVFSSEDPTKLLRAALGKDSLSVIIELFSLSVFIPYFVVVMLPFAWDLMCSSF